MPWNLQEFKHTSPVGIFPVGNNIFPPFKFIGSIHFRWGKQPSSLATSTSRLFYLHLKGGKTLLPTFKNRQWGIMKEKSAHNFYVRTALSIFQKTKNYKLINMLVECLCHLTYLPCILLHVNAKHNNNDRFISVSESIATRLS